MFEGLLALAPRGAAAERPAAWPRTSAASLLSRIRSRVLRTTVRLARAKVNGRPSKSRIAARNIVQAMSTTAPERRRLGPRAARRRRRATPASTAMLDEADARAPPRSPSSYAGKVAELDGAGLAAAMHELGAIQRARRPRRLLRAAALRRPTPPTRRAARCCSASRSAAPRSRRRCCSSSSSGRRSTTSAPRSCSPPTALDFCAPLPAHRPPLPPAPAHRARGEDPRREVGHRPRAWSRLFGERDQRHRGRASPATTSRSRSTSRSAACTSPDRELRARTPPRRSPTRSSRACAPARFIFNTLLARQGRRRPPAQLPALARQPQPRQRGLRRVGRGAGRGRPRALRHPAALVRAEGAAARASTGSPTTTAWPRSRGEEDAVLAGRGARARARLLRRLLARARRGRPALLRRALDRRAGAPGQARRRLLRLHGARASTPT